STKFGRIAKIMPEAARQGMAKAGMALLRDCIMDPDTVPLEEGTLRASGMVFVEDQLIGTSKDLGADGPLTEIGVPRKNTVTVTVGFNSPYAVYQHEGMRKDGSFVVENYSEPGSGPKFLENKLAENAEDYMRLAAQEAARVAQRLLPTKGGGSRGPKS
ncbi:MAG: minor capsid protein, partial [FCB group bacterium]|nr:minor capsid protein [FCB group bacterium]